MRVAYIFATSRHSVSYVLARMILPQLEEGRHGAHRLPLPVRLRDPFQVNFVHNVVGTPDADVRDLWGYVSNLETDLAAGAVQTMSGDNVPHPAEATYYIVSVNRKRCFASQAEPANTSDPCESTPDPTFTA